MHKPAPRALVFAARVRRAGAFVLDDSEALHLRTLIAMAAGNHRARVWRFR